MSSRITRVLRCLAIFFGIGIAYAVFVSITGIGIPCVFHEVTGLDCPSCGISRMFIALFALNIPAAFAYNPVILCLLPVWLVFIIRYIFLYITKEKKKFDIAENCIVAISSVILVLFGIVRNLI